MPLSIYMCDDDDPMFMWKWLDEQTGAPPSSQRTGGLAAPPPRRPVVSRHSRSGRPLSLSSAQATASPPAASPSSPTTPAASPSTAQRRRFRT